MSVPKRLVVVGGFYARDDIRGRTHIREVTDLSTERGVTTVTYKIHNLVGRRTPPEGACLLPAFCSWAERIAESATDVR